MCLDKGYIAIICNGHGKNNDKCSLCHNEESVKDKTKLCPSHLFSLPSTTPSYTRVVLPQLQRYFSHPRCPLVMAMILTLYLLTQSTPTSFLFHSFRHHPTRLRPRTSCFLFSFWLIRRLEYMLVSSVSIFVPITTFVCKLLCSFNRVLSVISLLLRICYYIARIDLRMAMLKICI